MPCAVPSSGRRHQARSPQSLESVYTAVYKILPVFFSKPISPPLNWDPLIKIKRDRPFLAFPFSEKAVKFSKRSQSQSKVCQELSSLGGCSRSPAGGAGCIIQNSLDPGKENRNQARARGAAPAPVQPLLRERPIRRTREEPWPQQRCCGQPERSWHQAEEIPSLLLLAAAPGPG